MKMLMGFVLGVIVSTTVGAFAQWQGPNSTGVDLSIGSRDYQLFWQQQQLDEMRLSQPAYGDPCRR